MTIRVLYFASLREALGCASEQVEVDDGRIATVGDLRSHLAHRGAPWTVLASMKNLRAALNQTMVGMEAPLKAGDEVAFFPPVTGG